MDFLDIEFLDEKELKKHEVYKKKNSKRLQNFDEEEKRDLIKYVKSQNAIWDLQSREHSDMNAVNRSWVAVAQGLGKEVSECKVAWKAIRESHRYRTKVAKNRKSGSSGGMPLASPSLTDDQEWELTEELSFLTDTSKKRRTLNSNENFESNNDDSNEKENQGSYYYEQPSTSSSSKNLMVKKNAAIIDLIETQKNLIAAQTTPSKQQMVQEDFWKYVDSLSKNLNKNEMLDMQKQILNIVFNKLDEVKNPEL